MTDATPGPTPAPPTAEGSPGRSRRGLWITLGVLGALLLGAYAIGSIAVSGDVPAGTTVLGVDIGGMSAQEAATTLEDELGDAAAAPIPVAAADVTIDLDPQQAGLAVDWEATATQASGVILNPLRIIAHLRGDVALDPVTTADEEALIAALEPLASTADTGATEPSITYTKAGVATLTLGVDGAALDVDEAAQTVAEEYFRSLDVSVVLALDPVEPTVLSDEAERVFEKVAQPAVALPVTLAVAALDPDGAGTEVSITGRDIAASLSFPPVDGTLEPTLDGERLHARISDDLRTVERPGRDATFRIVSDRPVIVGSRKGRQVDPEELSAAVLPVLTQTEPEKRTASVSVTATRPEFTTAKARSLNITEKLSSFRQYFPPAQYRYINVGQAAEYLDGTILEPGETFSMNDTIHERTPANGYTEGFIISGGRFREELGGGVSIITTATWTAGFYAGLERVEQHAHGLYISRYEAGLEATVAWGYLDLRMRNDTGNGVLITATRYSDGVRIEMWGTRKYDKVTATFTERRNYTDFDTIYDDGQGCVPSTGSRGFTIAVTRRLIKDGTVVRTETWPTVYKPTPTVVCGPKPQPKDDTRNATQ